MKKILLAVIIFISAFTIAYSQCAKPVNVAITVPSISTITMCQGTAQTLLGTVTVPNASQNGGFTYSWIKIGVTPSADVVLQTATIPLSINTSTVLPAYTGITGLLTNTGKYILRVEDGNLNNASCFLDDTVTITVHATITAGVIGAAQTICNGSVPAALTQTVAAGGGTGMFSYTWESSVNSGAYAIIASATNPTYNPGILINSGTTPMTIDYRRKVISGVCPQVATPPVRITVNPTVVSGIIAADQTICSGGNPASFTQTIAATGGSGVYTYQWESAASPFAVWTAIASATSTTYNAPSGITATTKYRRTDGSGTCVSASTNAVTLTIAAPLVPGTVAADQTICSNTAPAAFTSTAAATGGNGTYAYQWETSVVAGGPYTNIAGATNAIYAEASLITTDKYYRRKVISGTVAPCNVAYSNIIHVTVTSVTIPTVTITADKTTICSNTAITFTATPGNGGTSPLYAWEINAVSQGVPSSSPSFSTTALTSSFDVVRVILTSNSACASPTTASASMSVTVSRGIGSGTIGPDQTICYNTIPAAITEITPPSNIIGTPMYMWEACPSLTGPFTQIPGATNATYTPIVPITQDVFIRRVTTDPGTPAQCNSATSNVVRITVRPELTAGVIGSDEYICSGAATSTMAQTTAPTGGTGTFTYQWQSAPDVAGFPGGFSHIATGGTGSTYNAGIITSTMHYQRIETSGASCGSVTSNIVKKTVTAPEVVTVSINDPGQVCAGSPTIPFTATASTTGMGTLSYSWSFGGSPVGTNSPTYTYNPVVAGDDGQIINVRVTTSTGCNAGPAISNFVTLNIDPCGAFSTTINGPNPITQGQQNAVYSVPNQTGFTYNWSITGGTIISGQNTNSVTVDWDAPTTNAFTRTTAASYSISVLEKNQTNQTKTTTLDVNTLTTGTTLSQAQSGINVFPNPTTGSFNIEMPESGIAVSYEILDVTGLSIANGTFTSTGSNQNIYADLGAGMYQVVLKYNNVVTCVRLSKVQ